MNLEQVIPLTSREGHRYLIQFSKFQDDIVPEAIEIDIVDVVIVLENDCGINNANTLFQISGIIKEYLDENGVILYCFCDNSEIIRGKNNDNMSPQEYRSLLFSKLFDKRSDVNYLNKPIIINDPENGDHYIHLISKTSNSKQIDLISKELNKFNK